MGLDAEAGGPELCDPHDARVARDGDRPGVGAAGDRLDAVDARLGQAPVEARPERARQGEREPEPTVGGLASRAGAAGPQGGRRAVEDPPHRRVHRPHAAEAGGEGDLGDGEVRLVQQAPGEVGPPRDGHLRGRRPDVGHEQAAKVPRRHAAGVRQLRFAGPVESAGTDLVEQRPRRPRAHPRRPAASVARGGTAGKAGSRRPRPPRRQRTCGRCPATATRDSRPGNRCRWSPRP